MKVKIIFLLLACVFTLSSCYNYKEINQGYFATTVGIDIDDNNNYIAVVEAFVSSRSGEKEQGQKQGTQQSILFKKEGKTLFEALKKINMNARYKVNYMLNKAIIVSEKAARQGMNDFLDMFFRDQEFLIRQYIFIYDGDIAELLNIETKEDPFVGIFLYSLMMNKSATVNTSNTTFGEFMVKRSIGSKINVINKLYLEQGPDIKELGINKLAVIKDDKMVGELDLEEGKAYNLIHNISFKGLFTVPHPAIPGNLVTLEALGSKTNTKIYYDGEMIHVKKTININTSFALSEGPIDLESKAVREYIIAEISKKIVDDCTKLFNKYKNMDLDIYNLKAEIERKYPELVADKDFLENVKLEVIPKIKIEGSTDVTNYNL